MNAGGPGRPERNGATASTAAARPPPSSGASARWPLWLAGLALVAYALFLATYTTVVAGGSDSSGYLNSARLLAHGELQTELRVPAEFGAIPDANRAHFSPAGFNQFPGNPHLAPVYPTGLPLHIAAASRLLGWHAGPFLVQLLGAVAAVWLCYRTGRELGLAMPLAIAGAAMLAAFPVFIFTSIQTLSDTLATTWTLAAVFCALRGRTSNGWAAAAGAALAVAVLVRPTSILFAPTLVILLGLNLPRLTSFAVAGIPGAAWFVFYNHRLYGGALRSGYGNIYADFGFEYAAPTAVHFVRWLTLLLPSVMIVLPFAAFARRDTRGREFAALALGCAANIGLYLFYGISHEVWWCLRFILPGVALFILAGLLGVEALARGAAVRWRWFRSLAAVTLTGWALAASVYWTVRLHVLHVPGYELAYADAAKAVRDHLPPDALVACSLYSGALYYYTDMPVLNFDAIQPDDFAKYAALARQAGRPLYAVIFEQEQETAAARCPARWTRIASVDKIGIWALQ